MCRTMGLYVVIVRFISTGPQPTPRFLLPLKTNNVPNIWRVKVYLLPVQRRLTWWQGYVS